jgi:hypothetical protein
VVGTGRRRRVFRLLAASAGILMVCAAAALAQFRGGRNFFNAPARIAPPSFPDRNFVVCRIMYTSVRSEPSGGGWRTDYPYGEINLTIRLSELTKTPVSRGLAERVPNHYVVRLTDEALYQCPFTIASDVGTVGLDSDEAERLRDYLLKGGFLWVDDFWGSRAWQQWSDQMLQVLPEYRIVDVPADHPIRHTMFNVETIPQVTSINWWRRNGGETSERGSDSPTANFRMIADQAGRIMVLMTHNTDIGDSWEREGEDREFFLQFSPEGYALGINVVLYGLTH